MNIGFHKDSEHIITLQLFIDLLCMFSNRICGVMVSKLVSSVVDCAFTPG